MLRGFLEDIFFKLFSNQITWRGLHDGIPLNGRLLVMVDKKEFA